MYTAEIKNKQRVNGQILLTLEFKKGEEVVTETVALNTDDAEGVKRLCLQRIAVLERQDAQFEAITLGVVDTTPIVKTQAEIDANTFFAKQNELNGLKLAIEKGLTKAEDISVLEAEVKTLFKEEYVKDFRFR